MTMSQLLCASDDFKQIGILNDLHEIYRAGHLAFSESIHRVDCPYTYSSLESLAWNAGWLDAETNENFDHEAMRA